MLRPSAGATGVPPQCMCRPQALPAGQTSQRSSGRHAGAPLSSRITFAYTTVPTSRMQSLSVCQDVL